MSVEFIQVPQVTNVNGEDFGYPSNPNGIPMQIPCTATQIIGSFWRIPQGQGGRLTGYQYIVDNNTSVKPQADALKILRVKLTNTAGITQVDFAIVDADNVATSSPINEFAYLCDGSGGTLPVMPTVVIPYPILQTGPQSTNNTTGANTFVFPFPANPAGLEYQMNALWLNGAAPTPAYVATGITTVAGVASYANTHWSDFGTWTSSGDVLQLVSPTDATQFVTEAGINVALAPVNYCFNLSAFSTPAAVNQVKFGTGGLISVPAFLLTNNPVTLMNVLVPVMSAQAIFDPTSVAHKLGINTVQATPKLYNDGTLVATAATAVCS